MKHLKSVEEISEEISLCTANIPGGLIGVNWNAEITREETGVYLGWQSLKCSMIDNVGKVEFKETFNGAGTVLHKEIDYFPYSGSISKGIAYLVNGLFERMIREDIQRFKTYAEEIDFKRYAGLTS